MNKLDALKQYKFDGLLDSVEIWISNNIYIRPTDKTLIFYNKFGSIMLTDVRLCYVGEIPYTVPFNRYVIGVNEIKSIDI